MKEYNEKLKIMEKYYDDIQTGFAFHLKDSVPHKKIENAVEKFASDLDVDTILGFYDTTVFDSGKRGYIFTDSKVYYLESVGKPKVLNYDEIQSVELIDRNKRKDCDNGLQFNMSDDSVIVWDSLFLNKTPLMNFFNEILATKDNKDVIVDNRKFFKGFGTGAKAGGYAAGNYGTVNKLFDEEKFNARQGHGFAAERANNLYDKLTGHDAKILGDDNKTNGADRIVDGIEIQSKYCATGSRCINECFTENGKGVFRYYTENGKPMQIEVPSDKYDAAVAAMKEKIRRGQVNGVTDPAQAEDIVRKGHFTYEQAKNIAKAGTVESLTYDSINGVVIASSAFGVSAVITFATSVWNGDEFDVAIRNAAFTGVRVGGTAFVTSVLSSQLSKAGLNSALVGSTEAIAKLMGPKASATLVNAFRTGNNIYGAAAMKSAAKLLRGNVITAGVTVVVLSSLDVTNIFRGRISGKQLFKNIASTTSTVAGGTAGWVGGAAIGSAILPIAGTVIGGLIGSIGAGAIAGKASGAILNSFIEDDAEEMVRIIESNFHELAEDYLLNQKEAENIVDSLKCELDGKMLKDMFASDDRNEFARDLLIPLIEEEVSNRKSIALPKNEQMLCGIRDILEEIENV